jgi:hypothetical protein
MVLWFQLVTEILCVGNLIPSATVLKDGTFKSRLDYEGCALLSGLML